VSWHAQALQMLCHRRERRLTHRCSPVIAGLNIALSTPELVAMWIRERKKRWPSAAVVARKREEAWDEDARGMTRGRMPVKRPRIEGQEMPVAAEVEPREAPKPAPEAEVVQPVRAAAPDASEDEDSDDDGPPEEATSRAPEPDPLASPLSSSSSVSSDDSDDESEPAAVPEPLAPADEPTAASTSGRAPEETLARPSAPTCRFWLQGRCNYGSQCKSQHREPAPAPAARRGAAPAAEKRRARPRAPPPNPFQAPHALRALLANEIAQHVNYVAQVVRFLVRNDALCGVEGTPGEAEEQRKRREKVQMLDENGQPSVKAEDEPMPSAPLHDGGLPTVPSTSTPGAASLFRPPSPQLRALDSLSYPPEPDPMIFLDPLRAADVKPLTREQVLSIATDAPLRALLYPADQAALTPHGTHQRMAPALWRALETLDALPSAAHRAAALELILGVSEQSPLHAHQLGATYVRPHASGGSRPRVIGETELFRLGLRVSPDEVAVLRRLAQRVSELVGAVEFAAHEGAPKLGAPAQDNDGGRAFRDAQRAREYERMAQERDLLRSLGIDVD
jgi:hypothetical protein